MADVIYANLSQTQSKLAGIVIDKNVLNNLRFLFFKFDNRLKKNVKISKIVTEF